MSDYIKLNGWITEQIPGGVSVIGLCVSHVLSNETTVEIPVPFIPVGGGVAIAPVVTTDGAAALRVDLTRWSPAYLAPDGVALFPVNFGDQAMAVAAARAFNADPATSWTDRASDAVAWTRTWCEANGINIQGRDQEVTA